MKDPSPLFAPLALSGLLALATPAQAQSSAKGTILIKEDFSGGENRKDTKLWGGGPSWNIPETWEVRNGAIACIYDPKAHPERLHAKSLDAKFSAHNVRISYRIRFEAEGSGVGMCLNAVFPSRSKNPLWHIGPVDVRAAKPTAKNDVSIYEWDFTRDPNHPALAGKKLDPKVLEKPEGSLGSVYSIPGGSATAKVGIVPGKWYQFVFESVGTQWTLWVDGKETLKLNLKRADCEKETINFLGSGPLLIDDIVVEALPR